MPQETPFRRLNLRGEWPDSVLTGLVRDGERLLLPVSSVRVGAPWAAVPLGTGAGVVTLLPRPDGSVIVHPTGQQPLLVAPDGTRAPTTPEHLPPAPPADPLLDAARDRAGAIAASPAPEGWGPGFVTVGASGVSWVPAAEDEPVRTLAAEPADLAGIALDDRGALVMAGPLGLYRVTAPYRARNGVAVLRAPDTDVHGRWDRVTAELAAPSPPGTHVRLWTLVAAPGTADFPPPPGSRTDDSDTEHAPVPTAMGRWRPGPSDCPDIRVLVGGRGSDEGTGRLYVAVELSGDGRGTPRLEDVRVARTGRGLLGLLPNAYTGDDDGDGELGRLLGLFHSVYEEVTGDLDRLPALLDPATAPDHADAPWLDRLARWVDARPPASATVGGRRKAVAEAFHAHARRGTPAGLVRAVREATGGVEITVEEPLLTAAAWRLGDPEGSVLGVTTQLVRGSPVPPALDGNAILEGSSLIDAQDRGRPLYADVAHRVRVVVPATEAARLPEIRRIVERERPAHVVAEVSVAPAQ
ncbi:MULTISPECIES: phage tail protein [Streptomyces]|uniref:Phage tail protein n=2 Tax=Streptomyces TaxID=1883 RepID=A0ABU4K1M2_9ACTN|nr:phage tail protein [Streptomyces roseolus]MDX2291650.1 phage tail protein [Streptomyces roseolus]